MSNNNNNHKARPPVRTTRIWPIVTTVVFGIGAMAFAISARNGRAATASISSSSAAADTVTLEPGQTANVVSTAVAHGDVPVRASVPGRIEFNANSVTPVFAQFSGRVVSLAVEVGSLVREGQPLAMIDSSEAVGMEADFQQALAAARGARISHDQSVLTRDRATRLAEVEAIPKRELQEAQASETRAAEDLRQAEARLAAARNRLQTSGFGDDDIDRLEMRGTPSITRLVPLRAPVAGTITDRHVGLGQLIQPGAEALLKIADLSTVWMTADIYEDQVADIHPGAHVTIQTPAYPNETFTARVDRLAATLDPDKRTLAVRCVLQNADGRLKPGMFATVALQSRTIQRALLVPSSAIVTSGNRREVFVEQRPARYQERDVEIGDEISGWVVVKSGLRDGERVVTQGSVLLARQFADGANR
jgi:cobalt-zinc-cadmium efflux system membrane fusion protein